MTDPLPMPLDVRLMNLTTALLATGLVLACVAAALWWVLRNPAFAIRQIVVTGDTAHHSAASLRATVMPRLAGNFFTLDLAATQAAFQSVPWVRKAVVQREFPGRLNVTLEEHVAVGHWGEEGDHLVNRYGEVFEATADEPGERELPALRGPEGQAGTVLEMYRLLNPLLQPLGAEIAELTRLFEDVPVMYIADGHHRSAAAMRVADELGKTPRHGSNEEYNTFLAVIFPDNMMQIMDYNRLVKDLNGLSMEEFLSRVGEKFEISELENGPKPEARHQFSMYLTGKWRRLTAKEGTFAADDVIGSLDVSILQDNLLAPILGIKDPRTDERINFMGGIRGLDALAAKVDAGAYSVAFAMYPTSMEELIKVADAGKIMPPKSTWFEPKLRDAMVVHLIGEDE